MSDNIKYGKNFEFDTGYWDKPINMGFITVLQVGELCCESNFEIEEHLQICHEITYIISGSGQIITDGQPLQASAGDLFLTRKGEMHKIKASSQSSLRYSYFGFNFTDDISEKEEKIVDLFNNNDCIKIDDSQDIIVPFSKIMHELYTITSFSYEMVRSYCMQIMILTYRSFMKSKKGNVVMAKNFNSVGYTVYSIIRHINDNIYEINRVGEIADALGYNSSYISRIFRERMGTTIQSYLTIKKMEKAVEMIEYGYFSITEISERLRYATVQSFSKSFKRTFGVTPTEYQEVFKKSQIELTKERK